MKNKNCSRSKMTARLFCVKRRVLDLNIIVSKRRIKEFNWLNWLSNVKKLVLSNDSEHV